MTYIADTWYLKPPKIEIKDSLISPGNWYIFNGSQYLHKDGVWRDTMIHDNQMQYHDTEQQAIDLAKKYGWIT